MRKALLASTALVGAALLSAPAYAGTVGSGNNLAVSLSGLLWVQANILDEDSQAGYGRGYRFKIPETEVHINASNTADNGVKYGVHLELEANQDVTADGDEAWAFMSGDFGRLEIGDQDDVTNRWHVGAYQAHKGLSGPFGGLGGIAPVFHLATPAWISRTDWQVVTSSDATKIIYLSPKFNGVQVGASFTPDSGQNGGSWTETDNDGDYEKMIGLGARYDGKVGDVGLSASVLYETAEDEDANGADNTINDLEVLAVGVKASIGSFVLGANWRDNNETNVTVANEALGADAGTYWAVAAGYQQGPWGLSVWYSNGELDNASSAAESTTSMDRWGVGARYAMAPGWSLRADYNAYDHDNISGASTDNKAKAFILTNMFSF